MNHPPCPPPPKKNFKISTVQLTFYFITYLTVQIHCNKEGSQH
jgi:hypothetical protein